MKRTQYEQQRVAAGLAVEQSRSAVTQARDRLKEARLALARAHDLLRFRRKHVMHSSWPDSTMG